MRLKSGLWVSAYVRRVGLAGEFAAVVKRGDSSAGAIFIKINRLDGTVDLFVPALMLGEGDRNDRLWELRRDGASEPDVDEYLKREKISIDDVISGKEKIKLTKMP